MSFLHGLFPGHYDMKSEFDMVPIMMNVVMMRENQNIYAK